MINRLIQFSLKQPLLIFGLVILMAGLGWWSLTHIPIDAFPDVTNVQVQILVVPEKLLSYGLSLGEVFEAVEHNNSVVGGNFIEHASEQYIIRGVGRAHTMSDLENIVVKTMNGTPIYLKNAAEVATGAEVRQGAVVMQARGEVAAAIVMMLKGENSREVFIVRWLHKYYTPALEKALHHKGKMLIGALMILFGSLALVPLLGTEFIPELDEGAILVQPIRMPSISLTESIEIDKQVQKIIMQFPEVEFAVSRLGRPDIATDPMGINLSDIYVTLKPHSEWRTAETKEELVRARDFRRRRCFRRTDCRANVSQHLY